MRAARALLQRAAALGLYMAATGRACSEAALERQEEE
jgi:hypothetical protein